MNTVEFKEKQVLCGFRKNDLRTFLFLCNLDLFFSSIACAIILETLGKTHLVIGDTNIHTECMH